MIAVGTDSESSSEVRVHKNGDLCNKEKLTEKSVAPLLVQCFFLYTFAGKITKGRRKTQKEPS